MKYCSDNIAKERQKLVLNRGTKRLIFAILMLLIPLSLYFIFGLFPNINSFILAFQEYVPNSDGTYSVVFTFSENFVSAFNTIIDSLDMVRNSLVLFLVNVIIVIGLALIFSYYIVKGYPLAGFFRVVLFLPQIVSAVVLTTLFKNIANTVIPEVIRAIAGQEFLEEQGIAFGLLQNAPKSVQFGTILFYTLWVSFGTNVFIFTGSMSSIDTSILEAAQLDGANIVREFIHIYIPSIYPTFVTFIVTQMAMIFTNGMHLLTFFESQIPPFKVFGYFLLVETRNADFAALGNRFSFSQLSAIGLMITAVLVPLTLIVRKLMLKYGPRTD